MPSPTSNFELIIRQQPTQACVASGKEKERRPVDPPPIVEFRLREEGTYLAQHYLQSPHYFMCCSLCHPSDDIQAPILPSIALTGYTVSSLHRLKDVSDRDGGFFIFGDLSVKAEGDFQLKFTLFEMGKHTVTHLTSIISDQFTAFRPKSFPGMIEPTFLSKLFAEQGVRLRLRKKPRTPIKRTFRQLEDCPEPIPSFSNDSSIQMHGNAPRGGYSRAVAAVNYDLGHYTGPVKRQCMPHNFDTYNDRRKYHREAYPPTAATDAEYPRSYPTPIVQGHPTEHIDGDSMTRVLNRSYSRSSQHAFSVFSWPEARAIGPEAARTGPRGTEGACARGYGLLGWRRLGVDNALP
ncbi:velvet factor-domain-containing protein [Aspergillus bertholletiae]|uniref:Velvet factor-domain-containing protein n=1 Tax=Aspergillus bertholletiae TaxID=1226010 RepID=A0A5N7B8N1_9EURO|nr:velvet factor-domain-containing protein [Aspergillus bertholletiae]